jgi:hypothetical protein
MLAVLFSLDGAFHVGWRVEGGEVAGVDLV